MITRMELHYATSARTELIRTVVQNESGTKSLAIRGKTEGGYRGYGTFQWTHAVRGLALLLMRHALDHLDSGGASISGLAKSQAASLDYALSKGPRWLLDVFGSSTNGTPAYRRLFKVTNANRKRPGPVVLRINENVLPSSNIQIYLDGVLTNSPTVLTQMIREFEEETGNYISSNHHNEAGSNYHFPLVAT